MGGGREDSDQEEEFEQKLTTTMTRMPVTFNPSAFLLSFSSLSPSRFFCKEIKAAEWSEERSVLQWPLLRK